MTEPRVTVDFTAAEAALPLLPYVRARAVPPDALVDALIAARGIQTWLRHMSRYGQSRDEAFYRDIIRRAAAPTDDEKSSYLVSKLRQGAERDAELQRVLAAVKALDFQGLCERAYQEANENLDTPFTAPVDVSLMCATRGSAIVLDHSIVWDIADFADPDTTPLPLDLISAILAHEIFHMGREARDKMFPAPRSAGESPWAFDLLGMLVEEGAATYLYNDRFTTDLNGQAWPAAFADLPGVVARVSDAFLAGLTAPADDTALRDRVYGFFGVEGYVLGTEACRAIDTVLGRAALRSVLADRRRLFGLHNQAVARGGLRLPLFAAEVVAASEAL